MIPGIQRSHQTGARIDKFSPMVKIIGAETLECHRADPSKVTRTLIRLNQSKLDFENCFKINLSFSTEVILA